MSSHTIMIDLASIKEGESITITPIWEDGVPKFVVRKDTGEVSRIIIGYVEQVHALEAELAKEGGAEYGDPWEYAITTGPRKAWTNEMDPPPGEGWEIDGSRGRYGWERFDYHEERYWRRKKIKAWAG